jgi:hypothetical protein
MSLYILRVRGFSGRCSIQVSAYSSSVMTLARLSASRWAGGVHSPRSMSRRSSPSQYSASILAVNVVGAT